MGGRALVPRRGLRQARRAGPARAEVPDRARRAGRRLPARGGARRGARADRLGWDGRRDRRAHQHRHAADLEVRHRGPTPALSRARDQGREDRRARDHRARRRLRRRRAAHAGHARRRRLGRERREDLHHERRPRALHRHRREDHRGGRPSRDLVPDRRSRRRSHLRQAREARLARLRHRDDRLRGRLRPRGEPARRRARGLQADHGQLPVGAPGDGARRSRRDGARLGAHRGVRPRAHRLRPPPLKAPGDPPQARRPRHERLHRALRHLRRAAPVRRRGGTAEGGHDGQAPDPARLLRSDGRLPADPRRRRLHEGGLGRARRPRLPPGPDRRRLGRDHARDPRAGACLLRSWETVCNIVQT